MEGFVLRHAHLCDHFANRLRVPTGARPVRAACCWATSPQEAATGGESVSKGVAADVARS